MNIKKIRKGDMFHNVGNGCVYRVLGRHFNDYYCESSDEFDYETCEYINFIPCYLTASELRVMAGSQIIFVDADNDE